MWHLLAIKWLVARAIMVNLLSETEQCTKTKVASVYLQLVMLYQCSCVFWAGWLALREQGGLGAPTGSSCIIADDVYYI